MSSTKKLTFNLYEDSLPGVTVDYSKAWKTKDKEKRGDDILAGGGEGGKSLKQAGNEMASRRGRRRERGGGG